MTEKQPILHISSLKKKYDKTTALNGISLDVHEGEILGMIGPDGAGKTTAMRIACGLITPDEGDAFIYGHHCIRETPKIKEFIGYMPQRFSLYPDLTVAENLRFFADLYLVSGADRRKREERLMSFSNLTPFRSRRAGNLSGGMKQKLALACTLIHTPKILILDEPTTGVDPVSRKEFWKILIELAEEDIGIWISTPYMDEAQLCDEIALMHGGKILSSGTPEQVTNSFRRSLLELSGAYAIKASKMLTGENIVARDDMLRFGANFHIVLDSEAKYKAIENRISGMDLNIRRISPSIEDVFMQFMNAETEPGS